MKPKYNIMVCISCDNTYGVEMVQAVDDRDLIRKYAGSERLGKRMSYAKYYDRSFTTEQFPSFRDFVQWVSDHMENDSKTIQDTLEKKLRNIRQEQENVMKVENTKSDGYLKQLENLDVERDQMSIMDFLK